MCSATTGAPPAVDVVELLRSLIRHDTTNRAPGDAEGELDAARWVEGLLRGAGLEPVLLAREDAPHRANVVVRVPGRDRSLPGLLVHAHLDVVPAEADRWSVQPFAGELRDGWVWGRGAVDMKDMCAMVLAVLLDWGATGRRPRRDVVVAFVADEETDGSYGAQWLVDSHPGLFEGVEAGIGESGGSIEELRSVDGRPVLLSRVSAGERGTLHLRLTALGTSGHGSRPNGDNPVLALVEALHRIGRHRWPLHLSELVRGQLQGTADALGHEVDLSSDAGVEAALETLGEAAEVAHHTVRASTTPTVVRAGYKVNVIPGEAVAEVDVRCPPGYTEQLLAALPALVGDRVRFEHTVLNPPVEAPVDSPWFAAIRDAIEAEVPGVVVVPRCLGGGTDAKAFSTLGIACYGFAPLSLDPDGRTPGGMHGVDERVPVASLRGGLRILTRFLDTV